MQTEDQTLAERKARCRALNAIYGLLGAPDQWLLPLHLVQVKITHTGMSLEGAANHAPYYFASYPYPIEEPEYEYPEDAEDWPQYDGCPYKNAQHLAIYLDRFLGRCAMQKTGTQPPRFAMTS
ncbi:hypothetical protein BO99DRAFT_434440 [Aspergillus violaceofuscus CBS 115571]|uniref:Uncharacterized protein n=1 Tax=Aspergillus violaceofuscus (strain CBS 115571) TaxID=1450538 RepID=A0A2V5HMU7_ASPV1|nr:hypothetical protein BO99DRAFT_434440 [Aspergillus violaceofuscus CBS 115571]